jgi:hypothetical protein
MQTKTGKKESFSEFKEAFRPHYHTHRATEDELDNLALSSKSLKAKCPLTGSVGNNSH